MMLIKTLIGGALASALAVGGGSAVVALKQREINVTTDSAVGWTPSEEQETTVETTLKSYLAAKDAARSAEAHALRDEVLNAQQPLESFDAELKAFNVMAGPVKERRIVKVTWTKDPSTAPFPGVYAAVDLISRFANIQRHCGYVVLHQKPSGGPFKVTREEANLLDDITARTIEQQHSAAEVDRAWATLSAHCPNYPSAPAAAQEPLPEASSNVIGYPTVAAALTALKASPDAKVSLNRGWTVIEVSKPLALWSFAPPADPAYPAVAKREIISGKEGTSIHMSVHCEASKAACDDFVRRFQALNEQAAASLRRR